MGLHVVRAMTYSAQTTTTLRLALVNLQMIAWARVAELEAELLRADNAIDAAALRQAIRHHRAAIAQSEAA
jgi:hypothetical protein